MLRLPHNEDKLLQCFMFYYSGMHVEDAMNQHDSHGRVLVNVNKPANEPDIFLPPQLAKAVHPHQVPYNMTAQMATYIKYSSNGLFI